MAPKADINTRTVIGAVHELERRNGWPTAGNIAEYLQAPVNEVLHHLRTLRRQRILDDRQRAGKRVWMPWEECH